MNKKDLLELTRRFKKDDSTFTRIAGCFVNAEKEILLEFNEPFLNLDESDYYKYLEIAKKTLSGKIDNNLLQLKFKPTDEPMGIEQSSLMALKKTKLKDDEVLDNFYKTIISTYDFPESYLILIFHDVYDVITKTTDNLKIDESEEVYEYIITSICPVSLSAPGLSYHEDENMIKSRFRDWVVEPPTTGFLYPAFIERSADIDSLIYSTKNTKDVHEEFIIDILGCEYRDTITIQKEKFQSIMKETITADEDEANEIYMDIQDNLNNYVEDYKSSYEDTNEEPFKLTNDNLQEVLETSGLNENQINKVEQFYEDSFNQSFPNAENLIDKKILKVSEQKKKERALEKQVEFLKEKIAIENEDYDIILKAKPYKMDKIKTETIDGQEYIMIPINDNDKTKFDEIDIES